jgi:hypothetical protein
MPPLDHNNNNNNHNNNNNAGNYTTHYNTFNLKLVYTLCRRYFLLQE